MDALIRLLNQYYPYSFLRAKFIRDGGSLVYTAFTDTQRFFVRHLKPAFYETGVQAVNIQFYLQQRGLPVPAICNTRNDELYVQDISGVYIVYEYIEGGDVDPVQDMAALSQIVGKLHSEMKTYPQPLLLRGRAYYIDNYTAILQAKQYPARRRICGIWRDFVAKSEGFAARLLPWRFALR